ncbi:MFS transporter [Salmonella enterica]|nr:MFS transporter [Salmonella enterica]EDR6669116.1 MFS transporter [Salmonella enterica subsp. enterica]EDX6228636.1 MFS transporter [Salmonella enterica subsp. houtenae]EAU0253980.1 MFS transporter [Salmonella enterica]EBQ4002529.1 MFS transporter [Salmonella enterica]
MPEPVAEPALNGLRLNLRIVSIVMFNFASYLTIGLPLAVLPGYVHDAMGFSAFWAGLIISLQYFATLLSRPHAGRYADVLGPKKIVVFGLCGCFLSGLGYLLADIASAWPMISLLLLGLGRVILGIGQSFAGTGSTLWGVGVVGSLHIGRVISWNGIVTYGAMAMGAPLGVLCYAWGGLQGLALTLFSVAFVGTRLLFPNGINRLGGLNVAMICFGVEIIGLLLVGMAAMPWMAKIGVLLTGMGFSLVFPALGVVAVKAVPPQNQGAALATYTVFMDMSLGVTGPLAGLVMTWAGVPVIYLAAAGLVAMALLLTWRLKKRPSAALPKAASSS